VVDAAGAVLLDPTAELRQRITAAVVEFRRQRNPGLSDISICVNRVAAVSAAG